MKIRARGWPRKPWTAAVIVLPVCMVAAAPNRLSPQNTGVIEAELSIRTDQPGGVINPNIYGHFAEHLGRLVYDGIWVGERSAIPNTRGIRTDVVEALKKLKVPVLRWPGGCFADEYHWRDGIGPRNKRPRRINASWGGVLETNAFGTHEFMDLCELIGAAPYISGNLGSGTPQEMMEWVEYMTSDSDSTLANLRRKNGRAKPWKVPYFGVGNESWGCGGNMRPEYYADEYRRFATFVKDYSGNRIQRFASGASDFNYNWTEVLMSQAARHMQGLSVHYYTLPTGDWGRKGSATRFGEDEWHATLARTLRMDEIIRGHAAIMDRHDPRKRVGMIVDEWGTWYDPEPGTSPSALYQQNSLRDALVAALNFHIFQRHNDRVKMANIAQTVNVLQAVILTDKEKMILTPTYHVFEMYKVHQGASHLPVELTAPEYRRGSTSIPSLHASASRDAAGTLHLSIANLDPNRAAEVAIRMPGGTVRSIQGRILTGPAINSINTFDQPNTVKPEPFTSAPPSGGRAVLRVPPKAVVTAEVR